MCGLNVYAFVSDDIQYLVSCMFIWNQSALPVEIVVRKTEKKKAAG